MTKHLFDAHNHLQDERLGPDKEELLRACSAESVSAMVVNGSCETDWASVAELSKHFPEVIPSFGYHPWYVKKRTPEWRQRLVEFLDQVPSAVGEIGLDRWIKNADTAAQEDAFKTQLRLAAEREIPASIHCLKAWGRLYDLLKESPRPACGFVLHSFGGPEEMMPALAKLGAYFSLPGYFAHERKVRQREAFRKVPLDRFLIETDAPDQSLPLDRMKHALPEGPDGKPLNHPANIGVVYDFASELLGIPLPDLIGAVEQNFLRLFGMFIRS